MIPFSPRAALCTLAVVAGLTAAITTQVPGGLFGLIGMERDGLLAIERGGTPREEDSREIMTAVLAEEARRVDHGQVCVRLAEEGEALASERLEIARLQRGLANAGGSGRAAITVDLDRLRNPARIWLLPPARGIVPQTPLLPENARQLSAAETALLGTPASGRIELMLDMGAIPESLRSTARDCRTLAFTAPVVAGELAFVETRFVTAEGEPDAWLYAVANRGGRWRVEAMARPWT